MVRHHYRVTVSTPVARNRGGELWKELVQNGTLSFDTLLQAERFASAIPEPMKAKTCLRLQVYGPEGVSRIDLYPSDLPAIIEQLVDVNAALTEENENEARAV